MDSRTDMRDSIDTPTLSGRDIAVAVGLFAVSGALYALLALRLGAGRYADYYNLAFDFDPQLYVRVLAFSPPYWGDFKHPLILLLRPFAWPFLAAGLSPNAAAGMVMALFGAARVVLVLFCLRGLGAGTALAAALAASFALSGAQVMLAMIPESYGPAMTALLLVWWLAILRARDGQTRGRLSIAAAVVSLGVTITNLMQPAIARLVADIATQGLRAGLRATIVWGLWLALATGVVAAAVWHAQIAAILADPVQAAKEAYWLSNTRGAKEGPAALGMTFLLFSFVSPQVTIVPIPGGIGMWDFRMPQFAPAGWVAAVIWGELLIAGVAGWVLQPRLRALGVALGLAVLANLVLHLDFQFRGSLYLYAGHTHAPVFLLAAGGVVLLARRLGKERAALVAALLAAVAFGAANLPVALDLATGFDQVTATCPAPCAAVDP